MRRSRPCDASRLRDVLAHVASEDFVNERLVPDAAAGFLAELIEHSRIDSNRDQLARFIAKRRPADTPHRLQLLRRGIASSLLLNVCATVSTRPLADRPSRRNRDSADEAAHTESYAVMRAVLGDVYRAFLVAYDRQEQLSRQTGKNWLRPSER
jgi:hypothetical protein